MDREAKNLNLFKDTTISEYFLEWLTTANKEMFENEIMYELSDAMIFFYTTEYINYYQRKEAY